MSSITLRTAALLALATACNSGNGTPAPESAAPEATAPETPAEQTAPTGAAPSAPAATTWDSVCKEDAHARVRVGADTAAVFCARDDDTRHGLFTLFWKDGAKAAEGRYTDGARTGTWTVWNPTFGHETVTLATIEYTGGTPDDAEAAAHSWWLAGGEACPEGGAIERTLYDERTFVSCKKDGTSHGPAAEFHATGHRQAVGGYRHGEQHGHWIGWREEDGSKFGDAHFEDGVETGEWRFWDAGGELTKVEVYREGELIETREP